MGNRAQSDIECPTCKSHNIISSTTRDNSSYRTSLAIPITYYDTDTNSWQTLNSNTYIYTYTCQYGHRFEIDE